MNDKEKRNKINSDTNHLIICRDNEMNISDFLDIIWRRKILILVLFIASVAIATLIVNNMKPIYRTSAKITGGIIYGEQNGDFNYRDSPENILKVVNANMFTDGIIKSLRLNIDYYNNLVFKGELSSHSNVITVFYDDSDKASGVKILEANLERLDEYYKSVNISKKLNMQKQYYSQKQILLTKMANIKRKISLRNYKLSSDINNIQKRYNLENNKLANQGKEIQATLDMIKQEEENLKIQLKNIDIDIKYIEDQRNKLINNNDSIGSNALLISLLHSNKINNNALSYSISKIRGEQIFKAGELRNNQFELNETKIKYDEGLFNINREFELDIIIYNEELSAMQSQLDQINEWFRLQETRIVEYPVGISILQKPITNLEPVRPQKIKLIALAGLASLLLGILLATLLEYIKRSREIA